MKRIRLYISLLICLFVLAGCNKKVASIDSADIQANTILVREKGQVQACFVEDFDKDYYNVSELKTFIEENIKKFNTINGEDAVTFDSLQTKDKMASAIFTYADIEKYSDFNGAEAYFFTANEAKDNKLIPANLLDSTKGDTYTKEEVLKNDKFKVVIVKEPLDVIVDGTIKYYANAILLNKNTVQSTEEGYSVIVFKP